MDQRPDMSQTLRSGHQGDAALHATLFVESESSIPERQEILAEKREHLETQLEELRKAIAYIDEKQRFYADVTAGQDGILQQRHRHDAKRLTAFRR